MAANFYPGDNRSQILSFLSGYELPAGVPTEPVGAVVPHAGWVYSGTTAARTLYAISRRITPDSVIILGADHSGVTVPALFQEGHWVTPLGDLEIDNELALHLTGLMPDLIEFNSAAHDREHSIEVITPMIKYFWPRVRLVPLIVPPRTDGKQLGYQLATAVKDRKVLVIASSDLTHYGHFYGIQSAGVGKQGLNWLKKNDKRIIKLMLNCEHDKIRAEVAENHNACGSGGIASLLAAVKYSGRKKGLLIDYATSHGSKNPDKFSYGVGYAGIVY